jgi:hypothetical protein
MAEDVDLRGGPAGHAYKPGNVTLAQPPIVVYPDGRVAAGHLRDGPPLAQRRTPWRSRSRGSTRGR